MVEGAEERGWGHTSFVSATIINANPFRAEGSGPVDPRDLNPTIRGRAKPAAAADAPLIVPITALQVYLPDETRRQLRRGG